LLDTTWPSYSRGASRSPALIHLCKLATIAGRAQSGIVVEQLILRIRPEAKCILQLNG
jgi:hypothetical protein